MSLPDLVFESKTASHRRNLPTLETVKPWDYDGIPYDNVVLVRPSRKAPVNGL